MRIAALTMAYNEPVWARVWARFYAREVGAENCFLLDHGSNDGSTDGLGVRTERLARSALDEVERAALVGRRAAELLETYDWVVHSDADELFLPDPAIFSGLQDLIAAVDSEVVTAVGLDVQHLPDAEAGLESARPVGQQRHWVRFSAAMCKPALVRRPVRWAPGFHWCDAPMRTAPAFLLHLRYADLELGLRRLARTRGQAFADKGTNLHQRVSDEDFAIMMRSIAQLPRECPELAADKEPLQGWVELVRRAQQSGEPWLQIAGDRLWRMPDSWGARF